MRDITISVVTCTYNSEKFIRDNLKSVWGQNPPDEQIIVDAISQDRTIEIIDEYQKKGLRIKIIKRKPAGISDAMNVGFKAASGDVIQVLQSDDYVSDPNLFLKVRKLFQETSYSWMYGLTRVNNSEGELINVAPSKFFRTFHYYKLPFVNIVPHPSLFIKRTLFEKYGEFDTQLMAKMDWDYWLRIGKKDKPLVVPEEWTITRLHSDTVSLKKSETEQLKNENILILKKHFPALIAELFYYGNNLIALLRYLLYRKKRYPNQ